MRAAAGAVGVGALLAPPKLHLPNRLSLLQSEIRHAFQFHSISGVSLQGKKNAIATTLAEPQLNYSLRVIK
jgi:hypothetical protein